MPRVDDGFGNAATTNNRQAARNAGAGNGNQNNNNNRVPVRDISTQADPRQLAQQQALTRAQAAVAGQNFSPQGPSTGRGWLASFLNPVGSAAKSIGQSFVDQTRYGMNDRAQANYDASAALPDAQRAAWDKLSPAQKVQMARQPQMNEQLPAAMNDQQLTAHNAQRASQGLPPVSNGNTGGNGSLFAHNAGGVGTMATGTGAAIPTGNAGTGTFKPITFRSGSGTSVLDESGLSTSLGEDFAGLSGLVGDGTGLLGQAGVQAQQAPDQFNANFDPSGRAQSLFDERSALLEPAFAQQRAQGNEAMFGSGRLGLRLAGEGVGAGSGMVQPDAFGMNQAQSQALAQLSAQSTNDAFGQELQRAGLDMSQFGLNQGAQQQQFANLMGSGQGMLNAGFGGANLEQQLAGVPMSLAGIGQQQQALNQNYELGRFQNDTSRMLSQAQANEANYQPNPWLSGLTSLGSSFLGTEGGGDWLSGLFD